MFTSNHILKSCFHIHIGHNNAKFQALPSSEQKRAFTLTHQMCALESIAQKVQKRRLIDEAGTFCAVLSFHFVSLRVQSSLDLCFLFAFDVFRFLQIPPKTWSKVTCGGQVSFSSEADSRW